MIALFIDKVTKQAWTRCAEKIRIPKDAGTEFTITINGDTSTVNFAPEALDTKSKLVLEEAKKNQRYVSIYVSIDANSSVLTRVRYAGEDNVDGNLTLVADDKTEDAKAIASTLGNGCSMGSEILSDNSDDQGGDSGIA